MKKYEFSGKTREEALEAAINELNVKEEDLIITEKEVKGGLFKGKKVVLEVIVAKDITDFVKESLKNITKAMGIEVNIESKVRDEMLTVSLYSENNNILIGKNGRTIDALSTIIKQMVTNETGKPFKFNLDVADYKLKQQKRIESLAKRVARDVKRSKIEAKLDPMNSYERRIIHNILNDNKFVYTESEGEEPNRYVVIKPREE
ncbi:MAG: KH domain-containing protein [Bacilli bacterium]|nr:KH domain-containing protein [Bacilli bacterium]